MKLHQIDFTMELQAIIPMPLQLCLSYNLSLSFSLSLSDLVLPLFSLLDLLFLICLCLLPYCFQKGFGSALVSHASSRLIGHSCLCLTDGIPKALS